MVTIIEVTGGDFSAAGMRLDEIDQLLIEIESNPRSGVRLTGALDGWLVRHGGRGQHISIVFRVDSAAECIFVALVAFEGQDWMSGGEARKGFAK